MSVVLISLQDGIENLGLKYVHYALLDEGIDSTLLFLPNFPAEKADTAAFADLYDFIEARKPSFVGIGVMSLFFSQAQALTRAIKRRLPDTPVIWGGAHPTIAPDDCVAYADYACVGEGERVVVEVARRLGEGRSIDDVPGLVHRLADGSCARNPMAPRVENLDEYANFEHKPRNAFILHDGRVCALEGRVFRRYALHRGNSYVLMASRGCPYSCTYCCNNVFNELNGSRRVRRRGPENIVDDIERAVRDNPNIDMIYFMDDCFCAAKLDEMRAFGAAYKERIGLPFAVKTIASYMTPDKIDVLRDAGLSSVSMGLQSGSERVLAEVYKRRTLPGRIIEAVRDLSDRGIFVELDIIVDNPLETEDDVVCTVEALTRVPKPYLLHIYSLSPYFGTELYERIRREAPEALAESKSKDYIMFRRTALNRLAFIAPYVDRRLVMRLAGLHRDHRDAFWFKAALTAGEILAFLAMPLAFARLLVRKRQGSVWKAAKAFGTHASHLLFVDSFGGNVVSVVSRKLHRSQGAQGSTS